MRFADIRMCFVARYGGDPTKGDKLPPSHERSLKRALKGLRDRGEVLRIGGSGGPGDPYHYTTLPQLLLARSRETKPMPSRSWSSSWPRWRR